MTTQEAMGMRIKKLREEKKLSQTSLAELVGYKDKTAIAKVEAGKVDLPQSKIVAFSNALDTSISYLFGDESATAKIINASSNFLTEKDNRDIQKDITNIMEKLSSKEYGPAAYDGEDLSEESTELFRDELEIALKRLKLINKEKYNPNKNKK